MSLLQINDTFLTQALAQYQWSDYHTQTNSAQHIPSALWGLFHAMAIDIDQFYWQIENHVVVQGELYSAAEPTLAVLLEVISHNPQHIASYTLTSALELIYQIVAGATYEDNLGTDPELKKRILTIALKHTTVIQSLTNSPGGQAEAAREILQLLLAL